MNKNIEKIDEYLKGVTLPEYVSHQHRQQLRREVLGKIERRQNMSIRKRNWKVVAAVILICTGFVTAAAVVGIKYNYIGQDDEGHHRVQSEDGTNIIIFDGAHADNPEQAVEYAEEIALLKQQGDRELVLVGEIEVNGQHDSRMLHYKYNISDGRTIEVGERDPDDTGPRTLVGERLEEASQLLRDSIPNNILAEYDGQSVKIHSKPEEQEIETYEKTIQGRLFSFKTRRFTLSDGTEVAWSIGTPKENQ
jgi:hypothetical protein